MDPEDPLESPLVGGSDSTPASDEVGGEADMVVEVEESRRLPRTPTGLEAMARALGLKVVWGPGLFAAGDEKTSVLITKIGDIVYVRCSYTDRSGIHEERLFTGDQLLAFLWAAKFLKNLR